MKSKKRKNLSKSVQYVKRLNESKVRELSQDRAGLHTEIDSN